MRQSFLEMEHWNKKRCDNHEKNVKLRVLNFAAEATASLGPEDFEHAGIPK